MKNAYYTPRYEYIHSIYMELDEDIKGQNKAPIYTLLGV